MEQHFLHCKKAQRLELLIAQECRKADGLHTARLEPAAHGDRLIRVHAELALFKVPDGPPIHLQAPAGVDAEKNMLRRNGRQRVRRINEIRRPNSPGISACMSILRHGRVDHLCPVNVRIARKPELCLASAEDLTARVRQHAQDRRVRVHPRRKAQFESVVPRKHQTKVHTRLAKAFRVVEIKRRRLLLQ